MDHRYRKSNRTIQLLKTLNFTRTHINNSKIRQSRVTVLVHCTSTQWDLSTYIKFHVDTSCCFRVMSPHKKSGPTNRWTEEAVTWSIMTCTLNKHSYFWTFFSFESLLWSSDISLKVSFLISPLAVFWQQRPYIISTLLISWLLSLLLKVIQQFSS
jgi:hypothetical protein